MTELLSLDFLQRSLAAGLVVGLLCSFLSFFVVLRRLSFVGVGISHGAFGGVALGLLVGGSPFLAGLLFSTWISWAIGWVSRRGKIAEDTAIGILFPSAMAIGVICLGLRRSYTADLSGYLFGNLLAVSASDLRIIVGVSLAVTLAMIAVFKELLFLSFDSEMAEASGIATGPLHYFLLTVMAVTVVVAIKVVGAILVSALLVIPAAAARELSTNYRVMLGLSLVVGFLATLLGFAASFAFNVASGATIVLVAAALFMIAFLIGRRSGGRRRTSDEARAQ